MSQHTLGTQPGSAGGTGAACVPAAPTCDPSLLARAREVLRERFGYADFRPAQRTLVEAVLAGRDVLGVMPTGAGKSLVYQIPPLCWEAPPSWSPRSSPS